MRTWLRVRSELLPNLFDWFSSPLHLEGQGAQRASEARAFGSLQSRGGLRPLNSKVGPRPAKLAEFYICRVCGLKLLFGVVRAALVPSAA